MTTARRALILVLAIVALSPPSARAASYDVWSCHLPDGTVLPVDGWAAEKQGLKSSTYNGCKQTIARREGGLEASFFGNAAPGDYAGMVFTAPDDTTISGYTLWRWVRTASAEDAFQDYFLTHDVPRTFDSRYFVQFCSIYASCSSLGNSGYPLGPANRFQRSDLQIRRLNVFLLCDAQNGATACGSSSGRFAIFSIASARIALEDAYRPEFTSRPTGSLLGTTAALEGEKTLSFTALDRGGGIEKVGVVVDGQRRLTRAADPNAGRCRRPFWALKPCPPRSDNTLVFDTGQLANGTHTVQASVTDAAGNETRSDPVTVTTLNGSQPNGRGASRFVRLSAWLRSKRDKRRASAVVPYGAVRFAEGRLTDSTGAPIAGAVLDINSRVQRPGARYRASGTVTTSDDGRFAYRIPKGPSRTLRFEYKAFTLDPAPVSSAQVSLGVKAGIALKLRPRHVRNGQKITFKGRLRGGPARKGTRVTVDVLVPDARRRVPIGNVKADGKGRFAFGYRFRRTLVKARYRFRARLTPQPGYPYRGATSRRVSVVVSP